MGLFAKSKSTTGDDDGKEAHGDALPPFAALGTQDQLRENGGQSRTSEGFRVIVQTGTYKNRTRRSVRGSSILLPGPGPPYPTANGAPLAGRQSVLEGIRLELRRNEVVTQAVALATAGLSAGATKRASQPVARPQAQRGGSFLRGPRPSKPTQLPKENLKQLSGVSGLVQPPMGGMTPDALSKAQYGLGPSSAFQVHTPTPWADPASATPALTVLGLGGDAGGMQMQHMPASGGMMPQNRYANRGPGADERKFASLNGTPWIANRGGQVGPPPTPPTGQRRPGDPDNHMNAVGGPSPGFTLASMFRRLFLNGGAEEGGGGGATGRPHTGHDPPTGPPGPSPIKWQGGQGGASPALASNSGHGQPTWLLLGGARGPVPMEAGRAQAPPPPVQPPPPPPPHEQHQQQQSASPAAPARKPPGGPGNSKVHPQPQPPWPG